MDIGLYDTSAAPVSHKTRPFRESLRKFWAKRERFRSLFCFPAINDPLKFPG